MLGETDQIKPIKSENSGTPLSDRRSKRPRKTAPPQTLVVLDPSVKDYQRLAAGVMAGAAVVVLDPNRDGVMQITEALQHYPSTSSLHVIAPGAPGRLFLGCDELSLATIDRYGWDLQSWFAAPGHLLNPPLVVLYGCEVAAGIEGKLFVQQMHQLTGASIAASTTRMGSGELGGSWELDMRLGAVVPSLALLPEVIDEYAFLL